MDLSRPFHEDAAFFYLILERFCILGLVWIRFLIFCNHFWVVLVRFLDLQNEDHMVSDSFLLLMWCRVPCTEDYGVK